MRKIIVLIILLTNICASFAQGRLSERPNPNEAVRWCPNCGSEPSSKLAMSCEECGSPLEDISKTALSQEYASLKIRLMYTGDKPNELPKYAKLYVNGKYIGNVEQTGLQARNSELDQTWNDGLGGIYTAIYEQTYSKVAPGLKNIVCEMRFPRMGGILKSNKKAKFEYVSCKGGKETTINHYFNSAVTFTQHKTLEQLNPAENKSGPIPELPDVSVITGTGTAELSINY